MSARTPVRVRRPHFRHPAQVLVVAFATPIALGTVLLMLPIAATTKTTFITALFTATSAVCVTREQNSGGIVVVGLGRFGSSLAFELMGEGTEVLGIDLSLKTVQALAGELTHVVQADSTDEEAMRQLGVPDFEHGVIGIGSSLEGSILSASVMITLGVPNVWAKALTQSHARILEQIGVHHIVRPEHDMGKRVAHLVRGKMLDYVELDDGYAIAKTDPPRFLIGVPLGESKPRMRFGVTVVGVKRAREEFTHASTETVVEEGDLIIVAGPRDNIESFCEMR